MTDHPDIEIRRASSSRDWDTAAALLWDYVTWLRDAIGFDPLTEQITFAAEVAALRDYYGDARGAFFIARRGDRPVGHVAVRRHDDGTAELKRMYVAPAARGSGLADRLVGAVLDAADALGVERVWLESKRGAMDAAIAVYRRNGFVEVAPRGRTIHIDGLVVMEHAIACRIGRSAPSCASGHADGAAWTR
jgi:GNAT superfamily N-acetyltransferase